MAVTDLFVLFSEHMPGSQIEGLISSMAAYGNVDETEKLCTYKVSVFRASKLPQLEEQLVAWERYGFLRWHRAA